MKVSVIIPVYQKQKYLKQCLGSLEKQSFGDFEVVVVDDGREKFSIFNPSINSGLTLSKVEWVNFQFSKKIILLNQNHQGPAKARNLGVKKASGNILVFLDVDMSFDKNFIRELTKPIALGRARGTFSKNEYVANWENVWARCWNYNLDLPVKKRLPDNYPDQAPVFRAILKSEFDKVGGFDSKGYNDDWTLSKKLGYQAQAVKGAIYYHYNPGSLTEVFHQAIWRVKREYKFGFLGELGSLVFFSLPFSLILGVLKAAHFRQPEFLLFKIVFDLGSFLGLLEKIFFHKYY